MPSIIAAIPPFMQHSVHSHSCSYSQHHACTHFYCPLHNAQVIWREKLNKALGKQPTYTPLPVAVLPDVRFKPYKYGFFKNNCTRTVFLSRKYGFSYSYIFPIIFGDAKLNTQVYSLSSSRA